MMGPGFGEKIAESVTARIVAAVTVAFVLGTAMALPYHG